ncbi:MAG: diaminopimelate decarboxylase [Candidatus Anstonellales archaeon]
MLKKIVTSSFPIPSYLYSTRAVEKNIAKLKDAMPPETIILYACKANRNQQILQIIKNLELGIDAVSVNEVREVLALGFSPEKILFTGVNVENSEMVFAIQNNVTVNINSIAQLKRYVELGSRAPVFLRINTGVGSGFHGSVVTNGKTKFGIPLIDLDEALRIARECRIEIIGLHSHVGSGLLNPEPYITSGEELLAIASALSIKIKYLNFGGGFGIPYRPKENELKLKPIGEFLSWVSQQGYGVMIEPGRYIVGNAGYFLARVVEINEAYGQTYIGVNTGFMHFPRKALYGSYHHARNISKNRETQIITAKIVGNMCESGDVFGTYTIAKPEVGDIIVFENAGAYCHTMASSYNGRPVPQEIIIKS